jgi:hypothetical protein
LAKINCRCGLTITDLRSRLLPDAMGAVECLRWWMKGDLIDDERIFLNPGEIDENVDDIVEDNVNEPDEHSSDDKNMEEDISGS